MLFGRNKINMIPGDIYKAILKTKEAIPQFLSAAGIWVLSEVVDLCPNFNSGAMKNKRGKKEKRFSKHNLEGKIQ